MLSTQPHMGPGDFQVTWSIEMYTVKTWSRCPTDNETLSLGNIFQLCFYIILCSTIYLTTASITRRLWIHVSLFRSNLYVSRNAFTSHAAEIFKPWMLLSWQPTTTSSCPSWSTSATAMQLSHDGSSWCVSTFNTSIITFVKTSQTISLTL